jgi:L-alanine-DL-glutamate epimerase-like enolase superfamily enzyme
VGEGADGLGEDITLFASESPDLPLAGTWTLGSFCAHLSEIEPWTEEPEYGDMMRRWRNWAYESAALDLALTQAGRALHEVLGREPRPVAFVNSLGLGEPASADKVLRRLERYPDLRFKLDAAPDWSDEIVEALVGCGAVHTIDFKGRYGLEVKDADALAAMYERVVAAFPEALLEDPHAELMHLVDPARVSYDAPIHTVADLDANPARTYNIKPTRIGRLEDLFALYEACEARGHALYGGGMGELGVARGQVQLLASLFSPDGPNDIAPPGFNALDLAEGLPVSPLTPNPAPTGFRRVIRGRVAS